MRTYIFTPREHVEIKEYLTGKIPINSFLKLIAERSEDYPDKLQAHVDLLRLFLGDALISKHLARQAQIDLNGDHSGDL